MGVGRVSVRLQEQPSDCDLKQDTEGLLKKLLLLKTLSLIRHGFLSQSQLEAEGGFREPFPLGRKLSQRESSVTAGPSHRLFGPPF